MRKLLRRSLWLVLMLGVRTPAGAQEAQPAAAAEPAAQLEEVIVTATRREQNLSQVPIAVTEVGGDQLQDGVIRDTQSLQMAVPSLNITVSGSENAGSVIRIRGIGTSGGNAGLESSVGVFVDGVYLPRPALALADLIDIDRIEVLRGPQGTLFGKNTSVGAINISTQQPVFHNEGELTASAGNLGAYLGRAVLNTPLIEDTLAMRLSGQYNTRDGYIHNPADGEDYNDRDRYSLRGQLLWQPMPEVSLRLIADTMHKDERCCAAPYTAYGSTAAAIAALGATVFTPPAEYSAAFDSKVKSEAEESGVSAHLDWDLGWAQLREIISYRDFTGTDAADGDYNEANISYLPETTSSARLTTAEWSLHGVYGRLDWLTGFFFSDEHIDTDGSSLLGTDAGAYLRLISGGLLPAALYPAGAGQTSLSAQQDGKSASVFTHNVIDLGRGFDLSVGLRYLHETKEGGGVAISNSPSCAVAALPASAKVLCGAAPYTANFDDDRLTGTASLGKKFGSSQYLYASYSSGFKSGGINLVPASVSAASAPTFKPETVDSYELGLKSALFGRRLLTRTALFWMDFDDFQLNTYNGTNFVPSNVPSARSRGVEFEGTYLAMAGLILRGGATYADVEFGNEAEIPANLRGQQVTNAPHWVGQLGANYSHAVPWQSATAFGDVSARYQSKVNTGSDLKPAKEQDAYTLVNARLGLRFPQDFEVALWGANLTDEFYELIIFDSPVQTNSYNGYPGVPRTYGLEVSKRF